MATEHLDKTPDDIAVRALLALACARTGAVDEAVKHLSRFRPRDIISAVRELPDAELDVLIDVYVETWRQNGDERYLQTARKIARRSKRSTGDATLSRPASRFCIAYAAISIKPARLPIPRADGSMRKNRPTMTEPPFSHA